MVVCAGSFPELDGDKLFNTAVVYGPEGDLVLRHRKTHLYGAEPAVFQPGHAITVGGIAGFGRVGLCVCFAAPRHHDFVPVPELLVVDVALDDELTATAATAGMLWSARPQPSQPPP
jgi:predicted amidohydrolase